MKNNDVKHVILSVRPTNGTIVKWKNAPTKNAKNTPVFELNNKSEPNVPRTLLIEEKK